jgi:hypothetical protein
VGHMPTPSGLLRLKQDGVGFPILPKNWRRANGGWCTWHHRRGHIKMKPKTDGSMRWVASDSSTPTLSFSWY